MDQYNDFTYEPEEIETVLKSDDIRKINQDSDISHKRRESRKSNNDNSPNLISKSNNNTTENYQKEFDRINLEEMKEIEGELNHYADKKNEKSIAKGKESNDAMQELDSGRLDRLIENVLNQNDSVNNAIISKTTHLINTPKASRTGMHKSFSKTPIKIQKGEIEGMIMTRESNIFQTESNDKTIKSKEKRMKSASSINNSNKLASKAKDDSYRLLESKLEVIIQTPAKTYNELTQQNKSMIHYLSKLSAILSKQINFKKHSANLPEAKVREKSAKAVSIYQKEYLKLEARLKQLSDETYESKLIERMAELTKEISFYETENQRLKKSQKCSEIMLSTQTKSISSSTIELRRLEMDHEQLQRQHAALLDKVARNKEIILENDKKIMRLKEFSQNMETSAKESYGIVSFENVNEIQKKNEENKAKKRQLEKKYEILERVGKINKNKYESAIVKNEKLIYMLKKNKCDLQIELINAEDEQKQQLNMVAGSQSTKGDKCEVSPYKKVKRNDISLPEIKPDRSRSKDKEKDINPMRISKDRVIEQLEKKVEMKKIEKPIESIAHLPSNSTPNGLGKNIMNKPNFAFAQVKREDIRQTHSSTKVNPVDTSQNNNIPHVNEQKKEMVIADISAIQNNTHPNHSDSKNIIEEINIDSSGKEQHLQLKQKIEVLSDTVPEFLRDLKENKVDEDNNKAEKLVEDLMKDPLWLNDNDIKKASTEKEGIKDEEKADEEEIYEMKFENHVDTTEEEKKEEKQSKSIIEEKQTKGKVSEDEVIELDALIDDQEKGKVEMKPIEIKGKEESLNNENPSNKIPSNREFSSSKCSEKQGKSKKSLRENIDPLNEFEDLEEFQI